MGPGQPLLTNKTLYKGLWNFSTWTAPPPPTPKKKKRNSAPQCLFPVCLILILLLPRENSATEWIKKKKLYDNTGQKVVGGHSWQASQRSATINTATLPRIFLFFFFQTFQSAFITKLPLNNNIFTPSAPITVIYLIAGRGIITHSVSSVSTFTAASASQTWAVRVQILQNGAKNLM